MPVEQFNYPSSVASSIELKTYPRVGGYPFVGVLPELLPQPVNFFQRVVKEYPGEAVVLNIGTAKAYLFSHPDHVQYIFNDKWESFGKGKVLWEAARQVFGNSVFTNEGDSWFRNRRLMQPIFTASQINALTDLMVTLIVESFSSLNEKMIHGPVDIEKEMLLITQKVFTGAIFGLSFDFLKVSVVIEAIKVLMREMSRRTLLGFLPQQVFELGGKAFRNATQTIDDVVLPIIEEKRRSGKDDNDLLSRLLLARDAETHIGMSDQQVRDECASIFIAGFETTAAALTWVWYLLNKHPQVENRLRSELDTVLSNRLPTSADVANLRYTKMVIQESMRLYPPVWLDARVCFTNDVIGGYPIKAGSTVLLNAYATHRLPEFWEQPEVFNPERFAPENSKERQHPYAYFPFGGGPHLCLGKHFALLEMTLIIAMLVQKYRSTFISEDSLEVGNKIILRPRNGLWMNLEPVSS